MASPEEVVTTLPDTLPEDFGEWDGEGSPSDAPAYSWDSESPHKAIPVYSGEAAVDRSVDRSIDESSNPAAQSAKRKATAPAVVDERSVHASDASAPIFEPQKDFIDRDGEIHTPPKRVDSTEWKSWESVQSFAKTSQPAQSAERKAVSSPAVDKAQVSDSVVSTPAAAKKQEPVTAAADKSSDSAASAASVRKNTAIEDTHERAETLRREADEAIYQLFSARNIEVKPARKPVGKKRMIVAAVGGTSFLLSLVLIISLFHHGAKVAAQQSVQPVQAATDLQPIANKPKPSAGEPLAQDNKTAAVTATQPATVNQPASDTEETSSTPTPTPTQTQTQMMNDQLAAPTRIPHGANQQVAENEPAASPFGAAGAEGLGGGSANVSIFGGHAQTVVKAPPPKPVVISSGVAAGMLIHKTPPSYPPIAKAARVAGTVELHATISKSGMIEDLQVVNGPAMLRQAAADAVRTWRFQPYKLNNEPTEVETTINVVFTLGG